MQYRDLKPGQKRENTAVVSRTFFAERVEADGSDVIEVEVVEPVESKVSPAPIPDWAGQNHDH